MNCITKMLIENSDGNYREFSKKLIPDTSYPIIGIRTPQLKNIAKYIVQNNLQAEFLTEKHEYYEEILLHGLVLGFHKGKFDDIITLVDSFTEQIDNWAVCDCTVSSLKLFKKNTHTLLPYIIKWISSKKAYVVRFGIVSLLCYFLDDNYDNAVLELCASVKSDNYYINMALAWFFSVALVKQYDDAIKYLTNNRLCKFVHNKTIQKAIESFRIGKDKKIYLRTLRK